VTSLLNKLKGGDLRTIGRANEVAAQVLKSPHLLPELFEGLFHQDACVRSRSADALEKVSARHPDWLQPYRNRLLRDVAPIDQKEVRWHVAQILGRLRLTPTQSRKAVRLLRHYLKRSNSQIVKVSALQALADLAEHDHQLRPGVARLVRDALKTGSPSLKARARKLLKVINSC